MPIKENLAMPDHLLEDNETNQETKQEAALTSGAHTSVYKKGHPIS